MIEAVCAGEANRLIAQHKKLMISLMFAGFGHGKIAGGNPLPRSALRNLRPNSTFPFWEFCNLALGTAWLRTLHTLATHSVTDSPIESAERCSWSRWPSPVSLRIIFGAMWWWAGPADDDRWSTDCSPFSLVCPVRLGARNCGSVHALREGEYAPACRRTTGPGGTL